MIAVFCLYLKGLLACFTDLFITAEPAYARLRLNFNVDKTVDIQCSALPSIVFLHLRTRDLVFKTISQDNFNVNGPKTILLPCPVLQNAITDCIPIISTMSSAELTVESTTVSSSFTYSTIIPIVIVDRFDYFNCWSSIRLLQSVYEQDGAMDIAVEPLYCDIPKNSKIYLSLQISDIETVSFNLTKVTQEPPYTENEGYRHEIKHIYKINCSTITSPFKARTFVSTDSIMTTAECTRILRAFVSYPFRMARFVASFKFTNGMTEGNALAIQTITNLIDNATMACFTTSTMRLYPGKIYMELQNPAILPAECTFRGDVKNTYFYFGLASITNLNFEATKCYYSRLEPDFTFNTSVRNRYWYVCRDKTCKEELSSFVSHHNTTIARVGVYMTNLDGVEVKRIPFSAYPINVSCFDDIYSDSSFSLVCIYTRISDSRDVCGMLQRPPTTTFNLKLWYAAGNGLESANVSLAGAFTRTGPYEDKMCFSCADNWIPNDRYFGGKYCDSQLSFLKGQYRHNHFYMTLEVDDIIAVPDAIYFIDKQSLIITSFVLSLVCVGVATTIVVLELVKVFRRNRRM